VFDLVVAMHRPLDRMSVSFTIFRLDGTPVGSGFSNDVALSNSMVGARAMFVVAVRPTSLAPGQYYFGISIGGGNNRTGHVNYHTIQDCLQFEILPQEAGVGIAATWRTGWGSFMFENTTLEMQRQNEETSL
jgi:hypothetical protein